MKRREVKSKGEKERYTHLNAEFQRIKRKDKKAFLSDQCKEIEENNRMGRTRDLFKKIRNTKGPFHAKMWKVVAEPRKMPGFLASGGEEFNPGPVRRLDHSELSCNKVLWKYKRDRESFWHRHQKRAERVSPCLSLAECYIAPSSLLIKERKCLKTQKMAPSPSPRICILR